MKLFADEFHLMDMTDVKRMASSSNDKFCSLDMLAEVASATLQNDPSLTTDFPHSRARNKVSNASPRKSVNSCEKLSLDQIKALSEKNLIEMFSELICDEMRKNYSFQCFLIPDKCSQVFKSFGNETRARCKMKIHLQSHIDDLVAASNVINDHEVFMAEPLHVRRKRLREMNQKCTRKKKRIKQPPMKLKKDPNFGSFSKDVEDFCLLKSGDYQFSRMTNNSLNCLPEVNCTFNSATNTSVYGNMADNSANHVSKKLKSLSYFSLSSSVYDPSDEQVIFKRQSNYTDIAISPKNSLKRKHRSRHSSDTKKRTLGSYEIDKSPISSSDYDDNNSHLNCISSSASDLSLPVLHDHTYTSVNGKTFNCDRSSASESNRSPNKIFRDPFHPKKIAHHCMQKESPLIIPTPPFPYVYVPLLPHIALIQEVGRKLKTSSCKCTNDIQVTKTFYEYNYSNHVPLLIQRENEESEYSMNQTSSNSTMIDPVPLLIKREIEEPVNSVNESVSNTNMIDSVPLLIKEENEEPENSVIQSSSNANMIDPDGDENLLSDTYAEEVMFEEGSNEDTSDTKLSDSPFYVDDLMRNENPETLRAGEKKLALNCIRALRTKKKDERGPLTCQICKNKSFTAQATLMYHYRSHAGIKPFSCTICDATFTRQHSLNYHMLIHNNKSRFVCTDCGRNFRHPSHYKEHLRRHSEETPHECTDCNFR